MDRYSRQEILIGKEKQEKLRKSTALIVGLGGTGSICAELFARAGINLILFEHDKVSLPDLHRQILFSENDVGKEKIEIAKKKLADVNSDIKIETFSGGFSDSGGEQIKSSDVVLDCTDDLMTRQLINQFCFENKKPWVYSGAIKWKGMVMPVSTKGKPCFKCLVKTEDLQCLEEGCAEHGVFPSVPNIIGAISFTEGVKVLLGKAQYGSLYYYDAKKQSLDKMKVNARKDCEVCGSG